MGPFALQRKYLWSWLRDRIVDAMPASTMRPSLHPCRWNESESHAGVLASQYCPFTFTSRLEALVRGEADPLTGSGHHAHLLPLTCCLGLCDDAGISPEAALFNCNIGKKR